MPCELRVDASSGSQQLHEPTCGRRIPFCCAPSRSPTLGRLDACGAKIALTLLACSSAKIEAGHGCRRCSPMSCMTFVCIDEMRRPSEIFAQVSRSRVVARQLTLYRSHRAAPMAPLPTWPDFVSPRRGRDSSRRHHKPLPRNDRCEVGISLPVRRQHD